MIVPPENPDGKELFLRKKPYILRSRKKKSRVKLFLIALALLLVFVAGIAVTSLVKADRLMKQPSEPIPPYATNLLPSFQSVSFSSGGGQITLKGWLIKPEGEINRGTAILVHDQGGNRLPFGLDSAPLIRQLSREGFYTLLFDLRHSGESGGSMSSFGYAEYEDVRAAIAWTLQHVPSSPLILYGFGSGTTAIMRALDSLEDDAQRSDDETLAKEALTALDRIGALIVDTPARDSDAFISAVIRKNNNKALFWLPDAVPYAIRLSAGKSVRKDYFAYFSSLPLPVMIMGHDQDPFLKTSNYRPLIDERLRLHPERTATHLVPGTGHLEAYSGDPDAYMEALAAFLARWFPPKMD
ncbi:MAG TPA: alpha/beta fold hydrolase [Bacillota bacterium]|jgi:pimeloyl-ACP methyl ester carboxylesterase|nr:alpha/beta fold hydrolase [Fastidiosipila sp.]HPX93843.1 alpha/beta fold hydrolase [Bacillota bacterium]HQB81708.1 alpha/beta fold hydrolase [Bacillota bacterium]